MTPRCAALVREHTCCIYLRAKVDTLLERLRKEAAGRPMLRTDGTLRERISSLLAQRSATYEHVAHHIIDVDDLSIEDIARAILASI